MKVDAKLCCVLSTCFIANAMFMIPVSFLPDFLEGRGVSSSLIGLIFMCHGIAMIIMSPIVGLCLNNIGHGPLVSFACLIKSFIFVMYSITNRIYNHDLLVTTYIILELLEGMSNACAAYLTLIPSSYRHSNVFDRCSILHNPFKKLSK